MISTYEAITAKGKANNNMFTLTLGLRDTGVVESIDTSEMQDIVTGSYEVTTSKRRTVSMSTVTPEIEAIANSTDFKFLSDKIKALAEKDMSRVDIANLLGVRYQQVRQVMVKMGK